MIGASPPPLCSDSIPVVGLLRSCLVNYGIVPRLGKEGMATELLAHTLAPTYSNSERCVSHIPIFGRENICEKISLR